MLENIHTENITKKILFGLRWVGANMFLGFLILLFLAIVFSALVFYRYVFSLSGEDVVPPVSRSNFQSSIFQEMTVVWSERSGAFGEVNPAGHRDIFSPSAAGRNGVD